MRSGLFSARATAQNVANSVSLHFRRTPPVSQTSPHPRSPVVMLHGALASESTYRSLLSRPDFLPNREKFGIDLRNHGKSPHLNHNDKMTYQHMADDLTTFLDDQQIEKACLIGHSMGGKVAMHVALSDPSRVSELIVIDIAPIDYNMTIKTSDPYKATRAMLAVDLRTAHSRSQVDDQLKNAGLHKEAVRQFVMTNLTAEKDPSAGIKYSWKANVEAIKSSLPEIMSFPDHTGKSFSGPTCLIRGGRSNYVPFQSMRTFTSLFPQSKLVTISEAGHWLQAETPDQFCSSVNDFLND